MELVPPAAVARWCHDEAGSSEQSHHSVSVHARAAHAAGCTYRRLNRLPQTPADARRRPTGRSVAAGMRGALGACLGCGQWHGSAPLLHQCVLHAGRSRAAFSLVGNLSATRGAHDSPQPLLLPVAVTPTMLLARTWGCLRLSRAKTHTSPACPAAVGRPRWLLMTPPVRTFSPLVDLH